MGKRICFFGTPDDLNGLSNWIVSHIDIKIYLAGLLKNDEMKIYNVLTEDKSLGFAKAGDKSFCNRYLVQQSSFPIYIRPVNQAKGGVLYAIDQLINPKSILITPGGIYKDAKAVIEGEISTVSNDTDSVALYTVFQDGLKRNFKKNKKYYLGPGAIKLLQEGWRLVEHINQPVEYDFQIG